MRNRALILLWGILFLGSVPTISAAKDKDKTLILATTISTQDTGLLDVLIPIFEKTTGYFVKTP